ncbi:nicotinate-nucleotide adenylyltransferase [Chloroflexus sp.]|uniref:nicotinate-nucleotide adenylyltransferase n=1 Tax=Chloroflexus sp. TaxID=1904827 RepID=UPI002635442B|nr:nicotinate-nucleotide adenylyltransferase [uncultured Chloroflexus sp.]
MMAAVRRLGIYGGTFDPIHFGHLAIVEEARWYCQLDQILIVPAAAQPLKAGHLAAGHHRLEMVRLACANNPALIPSALELDRPPPSYTIDTLRICQERYGSGVELFLIVGADAAAELSRWREPDQIAQLARLVVVGRPGYTFDYEGLCATIPALRDRVIVIEGPKLAISSTDLRQRLATGRPVRYQLPDTVLAYLIRHQLYNTKG